MQSLWLSLLFCITLICGINAQDTSFPMEGDPRTYASAIIISVILMLVGLVFVFAGKRVIKILLFILGFIFFGALSLWIASRVTSGRDMTKTEYIATIVGSVVAGILGGLLSWCLYKVGIAILGFLMGFNLGGLIVQSTALEGYWARLGVMIGCGVAIAILTLFLMNIMIVVATSFVGSQSFMVGVDVIANKGYLHFVEITTKLQQVHMNTVLWAMLGSSLVLTLIGIIVQFKAYPKAQYYNVDRQPR